MRKDTSKKSENLEVRISYSMKNALYEQAKRENRTISNLVRNLITDYLAKKTSTTTLYKEGIALMLVKQVLQKPKTAFVGLLSAITLGFILVPTANADNILLNIEGEFTNNTPSTPHSTSTRKIRTQLLVDEDGGFFDLNLRTNHIEVQPANLILRLQVNETIWLDGERGVEINMQLIEKDEEIENILAQPTFTFPLGETSVFSADVDDQNKIEFKFTSETKP